MEFVERWKDKAWNEKEDRDNIFFWDQQKKEYLEENPTHAEMFAELETVPSDDEEGTMKIV